MNPASLPMIVLKSPKSAVASVARGILFGRRLVAINDGQRVGQIAAVNESAAPVDEWIRVTPFGVFPNQVGLQVVDKESSDAMVAAFNSLPARVSRLFKGLPIYEGHPDDPSWAKAHPAISCVARGRIKALETREDGMYGRVAYNTSGQELVAGEAPAYSSQSPRWLLERCTYKGKPAVRPVELVSIGLTNIPNIPGTELGSNELAAIPSAMKDKLILLLAALGQTLAPEATDDQITAAIDAALPTAKKALEDAAQLPVEKDKAATAVNEVAAAKVVVVAERTARADLVVGAAINEGRVLAADRGMWVAKLVNAQDPAPVIAEISALKPAINTQSQVGNVGARRTEQSLGRITAINEAVSAYQKANPSVAYNDAFNAVRKEKPTLFS